ncbi:MAG: imidazole glycerol phosphate synthase subunit HisH [Rhodospirillales bacterium]|nr:imidazole glycerol phosphate synthase subunit HisH [Rhodospirillales bacterium]
MILVLDYGRGNLFSLGQALRQVGAEVEISADPGALARASHIVFPGVGAFEDAMSGLRDRGLIEPLNTAIAAGTPLLGICVGCQLLLSRGEEFGVHEGLDVISGTVRRLPEARAGDPDAMRIPNVGWRTVEARKDDPVLARLKPEDYVYFVHSYAPMVDREEDAAAYLRVNGLRVPVAVRRGNVLGVQFHPEKSGHVGLGLLQGFLDSR